MSDTPKTDPHVELHAIGTNRQRVYVPASFARQLERENAKLKRQAASLAVPSEEVLREMSAALDPVIMGGFEHHSTRLKDAYAIAVRGFLTLLQEGSRSK